MDEAIKLVPFDFEIKKDLELVHILARVQIFAEVDVKVAIDFSVDAVELLEILVWEVEICQLWVDQEISCVNS